MCNGKGAALSHSLTHTHTRQPNKCAKMLQQWVGADAATSKGLLLESPLPSLPVGEKANELPGLKTGFPQTS